MPYSGPVRPKHPRTMSENTYFTNPGTFAPMGSLPRRTRPPTRATPSTMTPTTQRSPVFHFRQDDDDQDDDEDPSNDEDDDDSRPPPPLKLKPGNPFSLSLNTSNLTPPRLVPFPRTSPSAEFPNPIPPPSSFKPPLTRSSSAGPSCQIVLSNGKPLKSSLKSSSSAPSLPETLQPLHLRAQSAPSTPNLPPKNVHFAEKDGGLESVRVFSRSAKPVSITTGGDDTETETEQETILRAGGASGGFVRYKESFPFPTFPPSSSPLFELDRSTPGATSAVPALSPPPYANVHLETLILQHPAAPTPSSAPLPPILTGTIVVRNVAYEKHVAVRFTLDDWQTTSEVSAKHDACLADLPPALLPRTLGDAISAIASNSTPSSSSTPLWDRFRFSIRLEDYAHRLQDKVLWLVVRYNASGAAMHGHGQGEWWDNNGTNNYRVGFRVAKNESEQVGSQAQVQGGRRQVVSAPSSLVIPPLVPVQISPALTSNVNSGASAEDRRAGLREATTKRLAKLSLKNYASPTRAAPVPVPGSTDRERQNSKTTTAQMPPTPPESPDESPSEAEPRRPKPGPLSMPTLPVPLPPSVSPFSPTSTSAQSMPFSPSASTPTTPRGTTGRGGYRNHVRGGSGIGLHWAWGAGGGGNPAAPDAQGAESALPSLAMPVPVPAGPIGPASRPRHANVSPASSQSGSDEEEGTASESSSRSSSPPNPPTPPLHPADQETVTMEPTSARTPSPKTPSPVPSPPRYATPPMPIAVPRGAGYVRRGSKSPSPPPQALEIPHPSTTHPSDSLYDAFVKQWCFAQSSPPQPGTSPSAVGLGAVGITPPLSHSPSPSFGVVRGTKV